MIFQKATLHLWHRKALSIHPSITFIGLILQRALCEEAGESNTSLQPEQKIVFLG